MPGFDLVYVIEGAWATGPCSIGYVLSQVF